MHRDLYRVAVDQRLNTFGLVSVGQLVCSVNINFDFAAGRFFHELTELASALCPGTGLGGGAGKVPCLLRPVKVASVFYVILRCRRSIFLRKGFNQILGIFIALALQFALIPFIHTVNCLFERINIHILILCDLDTVLILPAVHDLIITGTVDRTLIIHSLLACLIDNLLLFRCQRIVNISVDAEEQAVVNCIPHRAVRLYFLYTGCVDCRKRILLSLNGLLLQRGVCLGPVHVGRVSTPAFVAFH